MNIFQRLIGAKPALKKPPRSEAQEGLAPILPYPDLPVLDGDTHQLGVKAFFVTHEFANYAFLNATIDDHVEAAPVINTFDGPIRKGPLRQMDDGEFISTIRSLRWNELPPDPVGLGRIDGHPIATIDVVTFPYMFAMMHDITPEGDISDWLWRMNHNMLLSFIEDLRFIGPAYTFLHTHAASNEHNPVHNIIAGCPNYTSGHPDQRDVYLQTFASTFRDPHIVSIDDPEMDCRYCYDRRLPEDGFRVRAEIISKI